MDKSVQYTIPSERIITLSELAKKWRLPRKLLFKIMEEKDFLIVGKRSKKIADKSYRYTTCHSVRTSVYLYKFRLHDLKKLLDIPNIEQDKRMCGDCRKILPKTTFYDRSAKCRDCRYKPLNEPIVDGENEYPCIEIDEYWTRRRM